ncbi:serum response factor-binding protein 1-like [Astatotilapia calliptera]|uniref:serum response factor-binding protein 1-like n=1 Tax=Astatotilapia calliptera TaxID=8154 RepID=UPI000E4023C6|nr:serum response factor-binding protein 1-like [Astatotilapia calliptera]
MSYKEKIPGHIIRREYIIQLARERLSVPLEELKKRILLVYGPPLQGKKIHRPALKNPLVYGPPLQGKKIHRPALKNPLVYGPPLQGKKIHRPALKNPLVYGPPLQGKKMQRRLTTQQALEMILTEVDPCDSDGEDLAVQPDSDSELSDQSSDEETASPPK